MNKRAQSQQSWIIASIVGLVTYVLTWIVRAAALSARSEVRSALHSAYLTVYDVMKNMAEQSGPFSAGAFLALEFFHLIPALTLFSISLYKWR